MSIHPLQSGRIPSTTNSLSLLAQQTSLFFGPYKDTQALYVTKFGNLETILRIRYTGILNKPPNPVFTYSSAASDSTGFTITFDASGTNDPENDALAYLWDFGDGIIAAGIRPSHKYDTPGEYSVLLTVTDSQGQAQQVYETVKIGIPPRVNILFPMEGDRFNVDEVLRLSGEALDHLNNPISDENFSWEVQQHHADHYHPFMDPTKGNNIDLFPAPNPEDYFAATNSFLRVLLTVTDSVGVSTTEIRDVQPNIVMVNIGTQPEGMDIVVDGYTLQNQSTVASWYNYNLPLSVVQIQPPYLFKEWSDGETNPERTFKLHTNMTSPTVKAIFCINLWMECSSNADCCSGECSPVNVCVATRTTPPTVATGMPAAVASPTSSPTTTLWLPADDSLIDPSIEVNIQTPIDNDDDIWSELTDDFPLQFTNAADEEQASSTLSYDDGARANGLWAIGLSVLVVLSIFCCFSFRRYFKKQTEKHAIGIISSLYGTYPSFDQAVEADILDLEENGIGETDSSDDDSRQQNARTDCADRSTDISIDGSGSTSRARFAATERSAQFIMTHRHVVAIPSGNEDEIYDSNRACQAPLLQAPTDVISEDLAVKNDEDTATLLSTVDPSGVHDLLNLSHMSSDSVGNASAFRDEPEDAMSQLDGACMVDMTPDKTPANVHNYDLETSIAPSMIDVRQTDEKLATCDLETSIAQSTVGINAGEGKLLDLLDVPNGQNDSLFESSFAPSAALSRSIDHIFSFVVNTDEKDESLACNDLVDDFDVNSSKVVSHDELNFLANDPLAVGCTKVEEYDYESESPSVNADVSSSQNWYVIDSMKEQESGGKTSSILAKVAEAFPATSERAMEKEPLSQTVGNDLCLKDEVVASLPNQSFDLDQSMPGDEPEEVASDDCVLNDKAELIDLSATSSTRDPVAVADDEDDEDGEENNEDEQSSARTIAPTVSPGYVVEQDEEEHEENDELTEICELSAALPAVDQVPEEEQKDDDEPANQPESSSPVPPLDQVRAEVQKDDDEPTNQPDSFVAPPLVDHVDDEENCNALALLTVATPHEDCPIPADNNFQDVVAVAECDHKFSTIISSAPSLALVDVKVEEEKKEDEEASGTETTVSKDH